MTSHDTASGNDPRLAALEHRIDELARAYRDGIVDTELDWAERLKTILASAWPGAAVALLDALEPPALIEAASDVRLLTRWATAGELWYPRYLARLLLLARDWQVRPADLCPLLATASTLIDRETPIVDDARDVTNGSGSSAIFHQALDARGRTVMVKTDRRATVTIERGDVAVIRGLEPYGGPAFLGEVAFFDRLGVMRWGASMELVPGLDLRQCVSRRQRGERLPLAVTSAHLASLRAFEQALAAGGRCVSEVNLGDFMLTPDGRVVPLDMYVVEGRGAAPHGGLTMDGRPIERWVAELAEA